MSDLQKNRRRLQLERQVNSCSQGVIDALRSEVARLSGKTGFCNQCETYAKEIERLKATAEVTEEWLYDTNVEFNALKSKAEAEAFGEAL